MNLISLSLLTPHEAALLLGTTPAYLGQLRYEGRGPDYIKLGATVRYSRRELERYRHAQDDHTFVTLPELAQMWSVSVEALYTLRTMQNGLRSQTIGGRVMIRLGDAEQFLRAATRTPALRRASAA